MAVVFGCRVEKPEPLPRTTYYVAGNGHDSWSGKLAAPNANNTDGPVATLDGARSRIRELKRTRGLPAGGVDVIVRSGTYFLAHPFDLSAEDSGSAASPIRYIAETGDTRLVGGRVIAAFAPVSDPDVRERLPPAARDHVVQADLGALGLTDLGSPGGGGIELFYDHHPMTVARWPNTGFVHIVDAVGDHPVDVRGIKGDQTGIIVYDGDRPERWVAEPEVWLHGFWFWDWSDQRMRVASIDTAAHRFTLAGPQHHYGYRKGQWYYAFNVLAELDAPGEWYVDRAKKVLYFWPPDGGGKEALVSSTTNLVAIDHASHITLAGFTLEGARGTAVTVTEGDHVHITSCEIRNVGAWAIIVKGGSSHQVNECEIEGTGQGGISMEGGDRATLASSQHSITNNHIHHVSRWERTRQPAVSIGGVGIVVANNVINDAPQIAIWFAGNDHVIERNEIHDVCTESNDAGAIYAGRDWTMRGTQITDNFIHDVVGFQAKGCNGVMLDDMFSGTTIARNVFYRVKLGAFIGGGRDNVIDNNVFMECDKAIHVDARAMNWAAYSLGEMRRLLDLVPYKSTVWSRRYPELPGLLADAPASPKGNRVVRNILWKSGAPEIEQVAQPLTVLERNLIDEDPRFVDPLHGNFDLRPDSPARRLGISPLSRPVVGAGRQ